MNTDEESTAGRVHPVDWLRAEYAERRRRNPSYSLRAFARHLSVSSGPLSEILQKKRPITTKQAKKIADELSLSLSDRTRFLALVREARKSVEEEPTVSEGSPRYRQIEADTFLLIADWYHYAILSLLRTRDARSEPRWIAARLGISTTEARDAMERLFRLGLLFHDGAVLKATDGWTTTQDVPSGALRRYHRQLLERAILALDDIPLEKRDVSAMTMAVHPEKLGLAKDEIRRFRRRMARLLEDGDATEVYHLSIQLVPTSKRGNKT